MQKIYFEQIHFPQKNTCNKALFEKVTGLESTT